MAQKLYIIGVFFFFTWNLLTRHHQTSSTFSVDSLTASSQAGTAAEARRAHPPCV